MKKIFLIFTLIIGLSGVVGAQWVACNNGLNYNDGVASFAINGNNIFAGTLGKGVYESFDNGNNWIDFGLNDFYIYSLSISGNCIFANAVEAVYSSCDSGNNWIRLNKGFDNSIYILSSIVDGPIIYAGTADNGIFSTFFFEPDGQIDNWAQIGGATLSDGCIYSFAINGNDLYVGSWYGLYLSIDNGKLLPINKGMFKSSVYSIAFMGNNIFAGTDGGGGIFLSTDNGNSWNIVNQEFNNLSVSALSVIGNNIFAGCSNAGIFLSKDSGLNWNAVNQGLTDTYVYSLIIKDDYIFAGTDSGVFRAKLSDFGITDVIEISNNSGLILKISPNPTSDFIQITNYELQITSIEIYNSLGEELKNLTPSNWNLTPSNWNLTPTLSEGEGVRVDVSDFPTGVYYCAVNAGTQRITKNFMVIK